MTYDDIRAALGRAAATDPQLRSLAKRIRAGKATFTDTAAYSQRLSALLGRVFSAEVESLSPEEREAICKALLRGHYEEINRILEGVQETLDEAQGLSLTPQRAPYPAERVQQLAHSLQDATAPPETIRRRADTGAANAANSMHDDYIDTNARARNDLGLKCYLTRVVGSTSCKWCANLAGRFVYGQHPDDIFRRHDNCTCTVTYACGRERQDVWSKRTWNTADPKEIEARAGSVTVNSPEDARKLEESAVSGLTLAGKRDIIKKKPLRISMQYFGKPNFEKQTTAGVRKSIRSLEARIAEHKAKIDSPDSFYPSWDSFSEREKEGYVRHWKKEISEFKKQVQMAKDELQKRGETP